MRIDSVGVACLISFPAASKAQVVIRRLSLAVLVGALSCVGQVAAQEVEASAAPQPSTPVTTGREDKVCHYEDVTGSRMKRRVCHTQERWEAQERAGKTLMRELDNRPVRGDQNEGE